MVLFHTIFFEFTNTCTNAKTEHDFTAALKKLGIQHKLIRPATPRHNGKVERSHRIDNDEFYKWNTFDNLFDLRAKMKNWLIRYNTRRPSSAIGYLTPEQKRHECASPDVADHDLARAYAA